jgi:hypothetical protein
LDLGLLFTVGYFQENVAIFVTKYILNISHTLSVWHALAYSSYKYVGMVFCLLCFMIGGKTLYYISLAYSVVATVFFLVDVLSLNFVNNPFSYDQ